MTGEEFRALRKAAGMSATQIAAALDYSKVRISQFENGHAKIPPTVEHAIRWLCRSQEIQSKVMARIERALQEEG